MATFSHAGANGIEFGMAKATDPSSIETDQQRHLGAVTGQNWLQAVAIVPSACGICLIITKERWSYRRGSETPLERGWQAASTAGADPTCSSVMYPVGRGSCIQKSSRGDQDVILVSIK